MLELIRLSKTTGMEESKESTPGVGHASPERITMLGYYGNLVMEFLAGDPNRNRNFIWAVNDFYDELVYNVLAPH